MTNGLPPVLSVLYRERRRKRDGQCLGTNVNLVKRLCRRPSRTPSPAIFLS